LGPLTDLYQLTMMAGYFANGMADKPATFELFVRRLPKGRAYLVFAGLEQAVGDVMSLAFSSEQVEAIRGLPSMQGLDRAFFEWLGSLRFRGDIWAVPEGTVVFPGEPLVRVEAPLAQAQWVETYLIAALNYPTLVASKAVRIIEAAAGRPVIDFGARRGHGPHAGLLAARASYLAGFAGTSHVEAAIRLGIPCVGTMAHSWVQAFATESAAFAAYARVFPHSTTLLIDTYDTPAGARHAAAIHPPIQAVRIDSGDLARLAHEVRRILDEAGRTDVKITVSSDLDEWRIQELLAAGAPIDTFAVGTELITSRDAPALAMVYKLVAVGGVGRVKLSPGKMTYPGAKQVYRRRDGTGRWQSDLVTRADETAEGEPLLVHVVRGGAISAPLPRLEESRAHAVRQVEAIPKGLRGVEACDAYPVHYSATLQEEAQQLSPQEA
jgi:nicotinate phosphoribosyltransferase